LVTETKIGMRLVSWLLSQDDHSATDEEFIASLSVSVTYQLRLDHPASTHVKIPSKLKIRGEFKKIVILEYFEKNRGLLMQHKFPKLSQSAVVLG
jgi:hypothetical protein